MSHTRFRAVIFDFDGTIADSEPAHFAAFQRVLARAGVEIDLGFYQTRLLGFTDFEVFEKMLPDAGAEGWRERVEEKARLFATLNDSILFQPGFEDLMETLRSAPRLAICSGAIRQDIVGVFEARGARELLSRFETLVSADQVERGKPDPTGYRMACDRLGLEPQDCVAVEDTPVGLEAAKRAGLFAVGVTHTLLAAKLTGADAVIDRLADLPRWL